MKLRDIIFSLWGGTISSSIFLGCWFYYEGWGRIVLACAIALSLAWFVLLIASAEKEF